MCSPPEAKRLDDLPGSPGSLLPSRRSKEKKIHLELLRIIAVYFVVLTHTGVRGFTYYTQLEPSPRYFLAMLIPVLCNIAVPLFYMISGANLIGKDESVGQIWRRRIPRYLAVLVLATLMMYVYYGLRDDTPMSVGAFLKTLYSRNVIVPYWYLYSYFGFLLLLPFLRRMIRGLSDKEFLYLFGLYILFKGIIPMAQFRSSGGSVYLNSSLDVTLITSDLVIFPAAGHYLEHRTMTRRQIRLIWAAAVLAVGVTLYMTHYKIVLTGQLLESQVGTFYKSLCLLPAAAVYVTAKKLTQAPRWLEKALVTVGSCTFGIYLIEQIIRERGYPIRELICRWMPDLLATLVYVGLVVIAGFCLIWIAKRLSGVERLI